ncbi:MAG TPA: hypothetical protein VM031_02540 [Phycisphaerae bacterium]|nr:hypothetical protein [Phycisphaerae bacterium]
MHEYRRAACAGLLLLALAIAATPGRAGGLLNPGFELPREKDGTFPGWSKAQWGRAEWLARDTQVKKEGECSLRVEAREASGGRLLQEVWVEPDAAYRLTGWVKTEGLKAESQGEFCGTLTVREGPPGMGHVGESGRNHVGTTDWVEETVDFIGPADGKVAVSCEVASGTRVTGRVWFDGLRLERLASPYSVGLLKDPLHGDWVRAARALHQMPPDWNAVVSVLESVFAAPKARALGRARECLVALHAEATADPAVRQLLVRFYGKCSLSVPFRLWPSGGARALLEEAAKLPGADPKSAGAVRLGLARAVALETPDPAAAAKAIEAVVGGDVAARRDVLSGILADIGGADARAAELVRSGDAAAGQQKGGPGTLSRVNSLHRAEAYRCVLRLLDLFLALADPKDERRPQQEIERVAVLTQLGEQAEALRAARRLAAPDSGVPEEIREQLLPTLVNLEVAAGEMAAARTWAVALEGLLAKAKKPRSAALLGYAGALAGRQHWLEAEKECRQIIAAWPQDLSACLKAQALIVKALVGQGRFDEAIGAARVLYGAAPNTEKDLTEAAIVVMGALKAKYRSMGPANEFAAYQQHGPDGPDGKAGTEDDLKDAVASFPYVVPTEAAAALKKAIDALPQDYGGRRQRGYLHLFAGEPALALREFAARFPLTFLDQKATEEATDDIVVTLRAYYGHPFVASRFVDYVKYGPNGKDGKLGTEDDLTDPVREILEKK